MIKQLIAKYDPQLTILSMDIKKHQSAFGQKLKNIRASLNLTQEEFCDKLNIEVSNLSKWENGRGYPSMPTFLKISEILKIEPTKLLDVKYYDKTSIKSLLINEIERLSDKEQLFALKVLRLMNEELKNS